MWSHYADKNQGICIEYDLKNSDCNDKKWNYKNVIFKNSKKKNK